MTVKTNFMVHPRALQGLHDRPGHTTLHRHRRRQTSGCPDVEADQLIHLPGNKPGSCCGCGRNYDDDTSRFLTPDALYRGEHRKARCKTVIGQDDGFPGGEGIACPLVNRSTLSFTFSLVSAMARSTSVFGRASAARSFH